MCVLWFLRNFRNPNRHIERTRAERRPGEAVALCSGCDQVGALAQPAQPVHRCEATAVHYVATDGAERLKTGERHSSCSQIKQDQRGDRACRSGCEGQPWCPHRIARRPPGDRTGVAGGASGVLPVRSGAFQYTRADGSVHKFQSS
jgi:hypothetical protein